MKLETKIAEMISHLPAGEYNVIAFDMWRDECGWGTNDSFRIASRVSIDEIPDIVRGRWEVIADNYGRQRVSGITDISYLENEVSLESDCFPVVDIRPAD